MTTSQILSEASQHELNRRCEEYLGGRLSTLKPRLYGEISALESAKAKHAALEAKRRSLELTEELLDHHQQLLLSEFSALRYKYQQLLKNGAPPFPFSANAGLFSQPQ